MISFKPAVLSVAALLGLSLTPSLKADQWNKKTVITIQETIQLPHTVLQPGTYVFKLADSQSDRHIVQIFNAAETQIIATILAIPNYRLKPTGKSVFRFWETPAGTPKAMRAWFYPGDNFGQEFAYPKMKSIEMAKITRTSVPAVIASATSRESARRLISSSGSRRVFLSRSSGLLWRNLSAKKTRGRRPEWRRLAFQQCRPIGSHQQL